MVDGQGRTHGFEEVDVEFGDSAQVGCVGLECADVAVGHEFVSDCFLSTHINRLFPLHAEQFTVGAYLKYPPR